MSSAQVSLVIPGRNCAATVERCLRSVVPLLERGLLSEIVFVNDGSTDETERLVRQFPVRVIAGEGRGPGAARNLGWRAARAPLVWFIDSDCVAQGDALPRLLRELDDPQVAGAGGSYENMLPDQLLACVIHEEIVARHRAMPSEVGYLATFNVLYRRSVLEALGGFDESLRTAEDAELAFRICKAGHRLRFDLGSRVAHYHPAHLRSYLRTQARHGFYRMRMYCRHPEQMQGDSYSGVVDHAQPPLAMLVLAALPLTAFDWGRVLVLGLAGLLAAATLPMGLRLVAQTRQLRYLLFAPLSFARAFWRGVGMTAGVLASFQRAPAAPPSATLSSESAAPSQRAA